MASVLEELVIRFVVDSESLKNGLATVVEGVKNADTTLKETTESVASGTETLVNSLAEDFDKIQRKSVETSKTLENAGKEYEQMTARWRGAVAGILSSIVAPLAGALAIGSVIQGYFSGVAEVAQMTGAYSTQLEEWRKKRALLARVNKEDIEVYRKGRETLTRFNIVMADMGTNIMRATLPAIRFLIDTLSKITDWVDRNQNNIVRFLTITASVITALLIPSFVKLTAAMLTNPLTWIVAAITALILVIDDLVTHLRGGESVFGDFWTACEPTIYGFVNLGKSILDFIQKIELIPTVIEVVKNAFSALVSTVHIIIDVLKMLFGLLTFDPKPFADGLIGLGQDLANIFNSASNIVSSAIDLITKAFLELLDLFGFGEEQAQALGNAFIEAFDFSGVIDKAKSLLSDFLNYLPDWAMPDSWKEWAANNKENSQNLENERAVIESTRAVRDSRGAINTTNNNNITVNTNSNDPKAIGDATMRAVQQANQNNIASVSASESGVR